MLEDESTHKGGTLLWTVMARVCVWKYYIIQIKPVAENKSC